MNNNLKKLILTALFIALCFIGGHLKIMGSIAFDALPAFIGTLILGWHWGAVIGALAHMLSALLSAFPLTLPVHLITAVIMAITMIAFYFTFCGVKKTKLPSVVAYILASIVAVIFNCPIALLCTAPLLSMPVAVSLIPILLPASIANVVLAVVIYSALPKNIKNIENKTTKTNSNAQNYKT